MSSCRSCAAWFASEGKAIIGVVSSKTLAASGAFQPVPNPVKPRAVPEVREAEEEPKVVADLVPVAPLAATPETARVPRVHVINGVAEETANESVTKAAQEAASSA